jgi:hypothetical protein
MPFILCVDSESSLPDVQGRSWHTGILLDPAIAATPYTAKATTGNGAAALSVPAGSNPCSPFEAKHTLSHVLPLPGGGGPERRVANGSLPAGSPEGNLTSSHGTLRHDHAWLMVRPIFRTEKLQ